MHKYIRIMRLNHWIKNLFVLPGSAFALLLVPEATAQGYGSLFWNLFFGLLSTCLIASANYVINEWLDAPFDRFHPVKKHRAVVEEGVDGRIVYALYAALTLIGFALGLLVSLPVFLMELWLWVMGILYNVKPFRTKDLPFVDVLTGVHQQRHQAPHRLVHHHVSLVPAAQHHHRLLAWRRLPDGYKAVLRVPHDCRQDDGLPVPQILRLLR